MLWRTLALLSHGGDRIGLRIGRSVGSPRLCQKPDDVLRTLAQLDDAIWAAHVLLICAESGLLQHLSRPQTLDELASRVSLPRHLVEALADILVGFGFALQNGRDIQASPALLPFTTPEGAATFRAALNAPLLQARHFHDRVTTATITLDGWTHTDEDIIEAQGLLTRMWASKAAPRLKFIPGLMSRLDAPEARLLDVGAGAAGLAITLCQHFPHLQAVALEPAPYPAAIGDKHVAAAGLQDRITIRRQRVEEMTDQASFDLAFLPQMFLPDSIIHEAVRQVFSSLKPGGWVLVGVLARKGRDTPSAIRRLKNLLWGNNTRDMDVLKPSLSAAGFDPVIRAPGSDAIGMICARRPLNG